MKSRVLFFFLLVIALFSRSAAQETSTTLSAVATATTQDLYQSGWGHYTLESSPNGPNPIARLGWVRYRTGVSFDISGIPSYAHITRADFIVDLRKLSGILGSNVEMNKLSQKVDTYNASTLWSGVGNGNTYYSGIVPTGSSQTFSFSTSSDLVNDLRTALTGNGIISMGFKSNNEGTDGSLDNIYGVSLKVYYRNPGVTVKNSFGGVSTGTLKVDGNTYNSGAQFYWNPYEYHTVEAIDQSYNAHNWTFTEWRKNGSSYSTQRSVSISPNANQDQTTYEAVFDMAYNVTVQNSFSSGNVKVDGSTYSSGATFSWAGGTNHTIEAIDRQTYAAYVQVFSNWSGLGSNISYQITITGDATYTANFSREFNIDFHSDYSGSQVVVGGTYYNPPTQQFHVVEGSSISVSLVPDYGTSNYVDYTFHHWSPGGNTSSSPTFTPTDHTTYTAKFSYRPQAPTNTQAGGNVNEHVHLTWTDNQNSNVGPYQISRRLKDEPSPTHVATVQRGAQSWLDPDYIITGTEYDHYVGYYVYAEYNDSLSYPGTSTGWASLENSFREVNPFLSSQDIPTKFSVGNYPNPFNPSTTIRYELPKDASVKMEIYDVTGRKVKTLLDGSRSAGYYSVVWNGRDENGREVASGMYLYRFTATPITGEKAFTQSGKLVLTK
jgi:hypothetical protein